VKESLKGDVDEWWAFFITDSGIKVGSEKADREGKQIQRTHDRGESVLIVASDEGTVRGDGRHIHPRR